MLVWLKSLLMPLIEMLEIVSGAVPVLVKVTLWATLEVFTSWLAKARVTDDKLAAGATPVPESVMGFTATVLLLVIDSAPLREPVAEGVNVTVIAQPAPGLNPLPQLLV